MPPIWRYNYVDFFYRLTTTMNQKQNKCWKIKQLNVLIGNSIEIHFVYSFHSSRCSISLLLRFRIKSWSWFICMNFAIQGALNAIVCFVLFFKQDVSFQYISLLFFFYDALRHNLICVNAWKKYVPTNKKLI